MDMGEATHLRMIGEWREIVEARGARLGLMSSAPESHAAEGRNWDDWWRAFSGDKPPIHRPHFWAYSDTLGSHPVSYTHLRAHETVLALVCRPLLEKKKCEEIWRTPSREGAPIAQY